METSKSKEAPTPGSLRATLVDRLDDDQLTNCMRCGFCLPACPTFRETGLEAESPRGRLALMKAVRDGVMEADDSFSEQMDHCLGCRACEPACPADVHYGKLLEETRDALQEHANRSRFISWFRRMFFSGILPHRRRLRLLGYMLRLYQRTPLQKIARRLGIMRLFPGHMQEMERILPEANGRGVVERVGTELKTTQPYRGRVGLFRGCIMDVLFTETNENTARLLAAAGYDVVIPDNQQCCGALHAHSGEMDQARKLARHNIRVFQEANVDVIVSNAGGCGALLVEYNQLLENDEQYGDDAAGFASRVKDISELMVDSNESGQLSVNKGRQSNEPSGQDQEGQANVVTYQESCHLRNVMKSSAAVQKWLNQSLGTRYMPLREADRCCGSAGIYNVMQPQMAGQILEHKMEQVNETNAHVLLTSNPGCLLQMKLGVERHSADQSIKVMHIVDYMHEQGNREFV